MGRYPRFLGGVSVGATLASDAPLAPAPSQWERQQKGDGSDKENILWILD
jgi:hypothetical protein